MQKAKQTKPAEPAKSDEQPTTLIQNCNFSGSDSEGVLAVARALEANAKALESLADCLRAPQPLLQVGK